MSEQNENDELYAMVPKVSYGRLGFSGKGGKKP
jgi:hypothetical protein